MVHVVGTTVVVSVAGQVGSQLGRWLGRTVGLRGAMYAEAVWRRRQAQAQPLPRTGLAGRPVPFVPLVELC